MAISNSVLCIAFFLLLSVGSQIIGDDPLHNPIVGGLSRMLIAGGYLPKSYIVYFGSHSHGRDATLEMHARVENFHYEFLSTYVGSVEKAKEIIFHSYKRHINGFAATLSDDEASEIAKHPNVISVFLNGEKNMHTTHSWNFLGLEHESGVVPSNSLWMKANYGEDVIIGAIDSGVWPESKSFSDEGYGPVPSRWRGDCENNTATTGVPCNRKLIGARFIGKGPRFVNMEPSQLTARDNVGHGTHALSTAGGNFVPGVDVFGLSGGTVKGGSPRARLAAYKVCWPFASGQSCMSADILEAFDMAIHDGVDLLSVSLGLSTSEDYFDDVIAIGAFHAVKHGITVVCSASNYGPTSQTVENVAPWIFTVGASTLDRETLSYLKVQTLDGGKWFKGESFSDSRPGAPHTFPDNKLYLMITGEQARFPNASLFDAQFCFVGALDPEKVKGKIVICLKEERYDDYGRYVAEIGAAGLVYCSADYNGMELSPHPYLLPATLLHKDDGSQLIAHINSTKEPLGLLMPPFTKLNIKPAPYVASFSARGPNVVTPEILKPDIIAPGVDIVAAYSEKLTPNFATPDYRKAPYYVMTGTSMSCPHIAGLVGLLKSLYPNWSPAAIKSAIMTTASTIDNTQKLIANFNSTTATPFDYGSGHINPNRAADPGLVYDISTKDYLNFLCSIGYNQTKLQKFDDDDFKCSNTTNVMDINYPAVMIPKLNKTVIVTRKVKNVGLPKSTYKALIRAPKGVKVTVHPSILTFERIGEEKEFKLNFEEIIESDIPKSPQQYYFGGLTWVDDGKHFVSSPIGVSFAKA